MASQKGASVQKLTISLHTSHDKIALLGVAAQREGKKLSLDACIDAVVTLVWMANGMERPLDAIGKVAKASIVSELVIKKNWSRMKAGKTTSSFLNPKNLGTKMSGSMLMRPWCYKSKVLELILGNLFVILP